MQAGEPKTVPSSACTRLQVVTFHHDYNYGCMNIYIYILTVNYSDYSPATTTSSDNGFTGVIIVGCIIGAVFLSIVIIIPIVWPICRLLRKFGFPFCSGSTEFCCICSPYCYCAGAHLREDHTGTLKVIPCADCLLHSLRVRTSYSHLHIFDGPALSCITMDEW